MRLYEKLIRKQEKRNRWGRVVEPSGNRPQWRDGRLKILILWGEAWVVKRGRRLRRVSGRIYGRGSAWLSILPGDAFEDKIYQAVESTDFTGWTDGWYLCIIRDKGIIKIKTLDTR